MLMPDSNVTAIDMQRREESGMFTKRERAWRTSRRSEMVCHYIMILYLISHIAASAGSSLPEIIQLMQRSK